MKEKEGGGLKKRLLSLQVVERSPSYLGKLYRDYFRSTIVSM